MTRVKEKQLMWQVQTEKNHKARKEEEEDSEAALGETMIGVMEQASGAEGTRVIEEDGEEEKEDSGEEVEVGDHHHTISFNWLDCNYTL